MSEKFGGTTEAVPPVSPEMKKGLDGINTTAASIDQKVARMTPLQKNRFAEGLKHLVLPDRVSQEDRAAIAGFFGISGGLAMGAEYMAENVVRQPAFSAQMREAANQLMSLSAWNTSEGFAYLFFQAVGNTPRIAAIAGAVGIATCVSGYVADKIKKRKRGY